MAIPYSEQVLPEGYERNQYGNIVKKQTASVVPTQVKGLAEASGDIINGVRNWWGGNNIPIGGSYTPMGDTSTYNYQGQDIGFDVPSDLSPIMTNQGLAGSLSGMWDSIGGAKGFADLAGGIGALGSLYTGYKQNKMAEQEHNARMGELARQRQRDADWQRDIKASGLGSYSAGMGGK